MSPARHRPLESVLDNREKEEKERNIGSRNCAFSLDVYVESAGERLWASLPSRKQCDDNKRRLLEKDTQQPAGLSFF